MKALTKIVATISDQNCDAQFIKSLYDAGMSAVRLNTAHQSHEGTLKIIESVRRVSDKIPLIIDTKGPEMRITKADVSIEVRAGESIMVRGNPEKNSNHDCLYITYPGFVDDLSLGNRILIDDGEIELTVVKKDVDFLTCRIENDGRIAGRKSVNVPGVHILLPPLTEVDRGYIEFAIKHKVDFIAHSFVRNEDDVQEILDILDAQKSTCKIIAKIENQEGVDNIDSIIPRVDGIMVARGDLGIEIPAEQIPAIQKLIIHKCRQQCKLVITATQMLHSMISKPRPTRAEVSDVANAVYDGTDSLMLSGETAYGKYPLEAVRTMIRIAKNAEKSMTAMINIDVQQDERPVLAFLARSAVIAETKIPLSAIIIDTATGRTARYIAAFRGSIPIYVECYSSDIMRQLAVVYGVTASCMPVRVTGVETFIKNSLNHLVFDKLLKPDDIVLILAGHYGPSTGATFLEITSVNNMLSFQE